MAFGRRFKKNTKKSTNKNEKKIIKGKIKHTKVIIDGITFDSKMESKRYEYWKAEKAAGRIKEFRLQPVYILQPKYFVYNGILIDNTDEDRYKEYDKLRKKHNKENPDNKIDIVQAIKYISDFEIIFNDGSILVEDPKGLKTADFKIKEKMLKYRYPGINFRCVILHEKTNTWHEYSEWEKLKKKKEL